MRPVGIQLEKNVAEVEGVLSGLAIIPIVGTLAGALKMILGTIQTVGGVLGMVVSAPFAWNKTGRQVFLRSASHCINGLANIVAGALEAIPGVGTAIGFYRLVHAGWSSYLTSHCNKANTGQETTIVVGYRVLEENPSYSLYEPGLSEEDLPEGEVPPRGEFVLRHSPLIVV